MNIQVKAKSILLVSAVQYKSYEDFLYVKGETRNTLRVLVLLAVIVHLKL